MIRFFALAAALLFALTAFAIEPVTFEDPEHDRRFKALIEELRCLQCQNQNLADSDAPLAVDLRHEIAEMLRAGRSDDEIRLFLVERYGDFVLYRPPVKPTTWLLWFGPLLILGVSAGTVVLVVRRRARAAEPALSESERAAAEELTGQENDPQ